MWFSLNKTPEEQSTTDIHHPVEGILPSRLQLCPLSPWKPAGNKHTVSSVKFIAATFNQDARDVACLFLFFFPACVRSKL